MSFRLPGDPFERKVTLVQPYQPPPPAWAAPRPPQSSGRSLLWLWILLAVVGGGGLLVIIGCAGLALWMGARPAVSASASQPFDVASIPPPSFPPRPAPVSIEPGVDFYEISLGQQGGYYATAGHGGKLWLYLPSGAHAPGSLPCIVIAGAGSNLISGMGLGDGDRPEHLPYAKAGIAVVAYELDGPERGESEQDLEAAYQAFRGSRAGMVNARNAIDFILAHVPEVDSRRIYSCGHSSAGTAALLAAEHDSRLAGCIAFAPCCDVTEHLTPAGIRALGLVLPGLADFAVQSSPVTHRQRLTRPVFLFHAEDDDVCDIADTRDLADKLRSQGVDVSLATTSSGGHYDAMVQEGIPQAIAWIQGRPAP